MEEKGVKLKKPDIHSGINQSGIIDPDSTFINTFLMVRRLQIFTSQNAVICTAKLMAHSTP